jgi:hypothetical protein
MTPDDAGGTAPAPRAERLGKRYAAIWLVRRRTS